MVIDVDGCLTSGIYYISNQGVVIKSFYTRDFYAIEQLLRNAVRVIIISQSHDGVVLDQVKRICSHSDFWQEQYQYEANLVVTSRVENKMEEVEKWIEEFGLRDNVKLTWKNVAYIGDAENDIDCMKVAGITGCPSDAIHEVIKNANYPSEYPGGKGSVYDFAMTILERKKDENS